MADTTPPTTSDDRMWRVLRLIAQRGLSQGVVFISTLFAARYATPDVFGQVGLFSSLCTFFSMASSLRFEIRGLVCKHALARDKFFGMAYATNLACFALAVLATGGYFVLSDPPAWAWMVPAGIVLSSLVQYVLPAQNSSLAQLGRLGWMTQVVATVTALGQVASALVSPTAIALIVSRVLGWMAGVLFMPASIGQGLQHAVALKASDTRRLFRVSAHEIVYGVSASLVSGISLQIPVYILTWHDEKALVGIYWLAFNLLFVPYLIVSSSIRPIFLRSMSAWRNSKDAYQRMRRLTCRCLVAGCAVSVVLASLCWVITTLFLSDHWRHASTVSLTLAPLLVMLVAQTPLSFTIAGFGMQRFSLLGGALQVAARSAAMFAALQVTDDALAAVTAFSLVSTLTYILYLLYGLRLIRLRTHSSPPKNLSIGSA